MDEDVTYARLTVQAFQRRLAAHPVGYIPLGTLEWHGLHNVLGADALQAEGLFIKVARSYGGIVFPPLYLGPDRITQTEEGSFLIGMDSSEVTRPHQQLSGSCYWVSKGVFIQMLESLVSQAKRAGFLCLLADGHGPSRKVWAQMAPGWEKQYDIILLSALNDFDQQSFLTQQDHGAKDETSTMMALYPDLVDLAMLDPEPEIWPLGVRGEDPRHATADWGEYLLDTTAAVIIKKLQELGL